jgi:hypothetical protein
MTPRTDKLWSRAERVSKKEKSWLENVKYINITKRVMKSQYLSSGILASC